MNEKIVLVGGSGFVGCRIAEDLVAAGKTPVCVSRRGDRPAHLEGADWAAAVDWLRGDARNPQPAWFDAAQAVVLLVGSPPVPTLSRQAYLEQVANNSEANLAAIGAAEAAGIKRLVVLGAHLPGPLRSDRFGYAKGKRLTMEAARDFVQRAPDHGAVVLQPSAIYGTRHSAAGTPIPLGRVLGPVARLQNSLPEPLKAFLPEPLAPVQAVAGHAIAACLEPQYAGKFTVIGNRQMVDSR